MITKSVAARAHTRTFAIGIDYVTAHTHQRAVAAASSRFEGGVTYASAPEKAAWIHTRGVISVETAALEMEAIAALSTRCRDPVYHMIIAYAKHELPTREQVVGDSERLLKAVGMEGHQYVLAAHKDTDDFHAHVIANRVGRDGRASDLWHERIIRERACAEIAAERGWDIVVGHHNRDIVQRMESLRDLPPRPERRLSDGAYRRLHERGELPWQAVARPHILDAVDRARDWSDLHQRLAARGVVLKLVRRGDRVQGLSFAEGLERTASGCAASRIDARCALRALEGRFGPFTPSRESAPTIQSTVPWIEAVRPTILSAVDTARSWDELMQHLDPHGIVMKLIKRGGRVQGLTFAQDDHPDAPGCGASRIDPRCKKAALEQRFGSFPGEAQPWGSRNRARSGSGCAAQPQRLREQVKRATGRDPANALREAKHIVDHARMRSAYGAYRDRFFAERHRIVDARRSSAWERERAQRQLEVQQRLEARRLLRAVVRLGTPGALLRQFVYWSIDAVIARRRAHEYAAGRVRWEAMKIVLASEWRLVREEKPMDSRSFVTDKTRAGDPGAQRVHELLVAPARSQQRSPSRVEPRQISLRDVRNRLKTIRAEQELRYERARTVYRQLPILTQPMPLDDVLTAERKCVKKHATEATQFTNAERVRLAQLAACRRSWNLLTRTAAGKSEAELQAVLRSRCEKAVATAISEFERVEAPQIAKRLAADESRYRQYSAQSFACESEMRDARAALQSQIPRVEHRVSILERAGVSQISLDDASPNTGLNQVAAAVEEQYRDLPETLRRKAEWSVRREQRTRDRLREDTLGRNR